MTLLNYYQVYHQIKQKSPYKVKKRNSAIRSNNKTGNRRGSGILENDNGISVSSERNVVNGPNDNLSVQFSNDRSVWLRSHTIQDNLN